MASYHAGSGYVEVGMPKENVNFTNTSIRAGFIRKVFMLVTIMLTIVAIMSVLPFVHKDIMSYIQHNSWVYAVSLLTLFIVYVVLINCEELRRSFPLNLICIAILTLSIGYTSMMICSFHDIVSIAICFVITAICCGTIVLFVMQIKYDLNSKIGYVFIFSMVLMIFGLVAIISMIFFKIKFLYLIYAGLAALWVMFYLAIDIQKIMKSRKFEISPEEHIFATIQVFLDIIYNFWRLFYCFLWLKSNPSEERKATDPVSANCSSQ